MAAITPFSIAIPDSALSDLKTRLELTRWPDAETVADWSQGIPLAYLQELRDYWLHDYQWREREALLNRHPQYRVHLDGLDIHFLQIPSPSNLARPLLLTHGWPGSVVEFQKVIGPLTDPVAHGGREADAFHLVCPSLPGFGFSGKPRETGWDVAKIAAVWDQLLWDLGYERYFAQGGDWGSMITTEIALQDQGHCAGIHLNMPLVKPDPDTLDNPSALEQEALRAAKFYQRQDSAYSKQQATRPQTLSYGLADSPMGQAAWIMEKFYQWMDCGGRPENVVSRDELLDNVMLYWLTNSAASSARIYWESLAKVDQTTPVALPAGISQFPKEIFKTSEPWARQRFTDLRHFNVVDKGGHFAAFEQPALYVQELRDCFAKITL